MRVQREYNLFNFLCVPSLSLCIPLLPSLPTTFALYSRKERSRLYRCSQGRNWGEALWARAPSFISYFGQGYVSNRGATHYALDLRSCIISSFLLQINPLFKFNQLRPWMLQHPKEKQEYLSYEKMRSFKDRIIESYVMKKDHLLACTHILILKFWFLKKQITFVVWISI